MICQTCHDAVHAGTMEIGELKVTRGKIIGDPAKIGEDTYQISIFHEDVISEVTISLFDNLSGFGKIAYSISAYDGPWYLYVTDIDMITRHKAIYYAWRILSEEEYPSLKYSELRSKKLN